MLAVNISTSISHTASCLSAARTWNLREGSLSDDFLNEVSSRFLTLDDAVCVPISYSGEARGCCPPHGALGLYARAQGLTLFTTDR